jgi:hypothetical protein
VSSRPIIPPHKVINAGSLAGNVISDVTIIQNSSDISYDISWTGSSPVGVMSVEVSNTYSQNGDGSVRNAGTWRTLTGMSAAVSGNTGDGGFDIVGTAFFAIRLHYVRTSGTGTINATITAKVS